MIHKKIVVIGGGPAGLCAAIEAGNAGAEVLVIDENGTAGGQLFKQIHKFFGSKEHKAGMRGYEIGKELLYQIEQQVNIELWLNTEVVGINKEKELWVVQQGKLATTLRADKIIIASGAVEKAIHFPGWTLPGVMGAGAAQTMMNIHRVLPGKRVLMIGSGNVGAIIAYQLLQAGAEVVGILEAASSLGGYGVHSAKVCRAGVPFYTSYTIQSAIGSLCVEGAQIIKLDQKWHPIEGTEKTLEVDLICLATGFNALTELTWISGCKFMYVPELGGHIPLHNDTMETTVKGIYIAGDLSGIEEASTAMEEGRLAGSHAAYSLGLMDKNKWMVMKKEIWARLNELRSGELDKRRRLGKDKIFDKYRESELNETFTS